MPCFWGEGEVRMIVKIIQISLSHNSFFPFRIIFIELDEQRELVAQAVPSLLSHSKCSLQWLSLNKGGFF